MKRDLNKFFNPKSIAIIGASNNLEKIGGILMKKLNKFEGEIIPINPKYKKIFNKDCYNSVLKYEKSIDLVIITIPSKLVMKVLKECIRKKIKNIIIISAGFSEKGNKKLERKLIKISKKYSMNILGPNCFGIANPFLNLDSTFSNLSPSKGSTAFISQSGALASYIFDLQNTKLSGFISLGNACDLDFTEWIKYFSKDKKTKKIILYMEKVQEGKEFIKTCKNCKKEIIVIKTGKTKEGSIAAISHTGSLATDYQIYKGIFKQLKIKMVNPQFNPINENFKKIKGKNVLIVTNAGGAGALMSDIIKEKGFNLIEKPIDILGDANSKTYEKKLNELKKRKDFDFIILILTPQKMSEPEKTAKTIVKFSKHKKLIVCFLGEKSIKTAKKIFRKNKVNFIKNTHNVKKILGTNF